MSMSMWFSAPGGASRATTKRFHRSRASDESTGKKPEAATTLEAKKGEHIKIRSGVPTLLEHPPRQPCW